VGKVFQFCLDGVESSVTCHPYTDLELKKGFAKPLLTMISWQEWQSKYRTLLEGCYNETTMASIREVLDEGDES
jgi:hypothetical protein